MRNARPDWGMLLEEGGEIAGDPAKPRWIVDPLDGTTNFLHGIPHFAISIAVEERKPDGRSEITQGLVYQPLTDESFWAEKGRGAWLHDRRLRVSAPPRPRRGADRHRPSRISGAAMSRAGARIYGAIAPEVSGIRRFGAAALDLAWVAAGPVRRLLGRRSRHLGHGRGGAAGQGSGRLRQRLSRPGPHVRAPRISRRQRRAALASCTSCSPGALR